MPKHVFLWYAECGCCHSTGTLWTCQVTWPDVNPGVTPSDPSSELQQTLPENINTWAIRVQKTLQHQHILNELYLLSWNSYIIDPIYISLIHLPLTFVVISGQRWHQASAPSAPCATAHGGPPAASRAHRRSNASCGCCWCQSAGRPRRTWEKNDQARGGGPEVALCQGEYGAIFYWCLLLLLLLQSDIIVIICYYFL